MKFRMLGLVAVIAGCRAPVATRHAAGEAPLPQGVALATFDSLWSKVSNTYVDTAFVSHRWTQVRDSLRPEAATISQRPQLDGLIARALRNIPDSHFYVIPANVAGDDSETGSANGRGTTGVSLRTSENQLIVWRVEPGSPGAIARIRPGEVVIRVGSKDAAPAIARIGTLPEMARQRALLDMLHAFNGPLSPEVGDTVTIELAGKPRMLKSLVGVEAKGRVSQFGNLPPIAGQVTSSRNPLPAGSGCIGVIAFNIWLPELGGDLEKAVDHVRSCTGIVVDLRGNPGGVGAMVMGFGGYFVDSVQSLGTMKTRLVNLRFVINPRHANDDGAARTPFAGPLAILVDPMTASTSEIFATGMQRIGRARVFGQQSAGAALPALMERLPSGDVFVHAVADFTDPDGKRVEGAGVTPDEVVPLLVKDVADGRDTALDAAVRWITTGRRITPAGE